MKTSIHLSTKLVKGLAMLALTSMLAACGSNSSPGPSDDGSVGPMSFAGNVRKVAGLYTGSCTMAYANGVQRSCTARIRVKQDMRALSVRAQFFPRPANRRDNDAIANIDTLDVFRLSGNSLVNAQNEGGSIGAAGFGYRRGGRDFMFVSNGIASFQFSGAFVDDSGRAVQITGQVQR